MRQTDSADPLDRKFTVKDFDGKGVRGKYFQPVKESDPTKAAPRMKIDLKARLRKDRPKTAVTINMPEDVVGELKIVASKLGFSSHEALIRFYVGQGLRADISRLIKEGR